MSKGITNSFIFPVSERRLSIVAVKIVYGFDSERFSKELFRKGKGILPAFVR